MTQEIPETSEKANILVEVSKGNITDITVDAIAAVITPKLEIRGDMNKAIFKQAGSEMDDFILENIISPQVGDTFAVPGFNLPAKHVIFSVVPLWRSDLDIVDKHLLNAIRGIVEMAREMKLKSLAIPLLCCGQKRISYPPLRGVRLILQGVSNRLGAPLQHINFVCEDDHIVNLYRKRLGL